MHTAFYRVCEALQFSGARHDLMAELVALKIIELTKDGELDLDRLCSRALMELDAPPER
jgi:hypothetical protein